VNGRASIASPRLRPARSSEVGTFRRHGPFTFETGGCQKFGVARIGILMALVVVAIGVGMTVSASPASAGLPGAYINPLSPLDTPDSDVVRLGNVYYAFSTGDGFDNVPVMTTTNLSSWPQTLLLNPDVSDALPCQTGTVPDGDCQISHWATRAPDNGAAWSPSMIEAGDEYYLFYAAWDPSVSHYCVGVAVSLSPMGPYVDHSAGPIVCQPSLGGSIDPDVYEDAAGNYYLAWKNNDGYNSTTPATLWASHVVFDTYGAELVGSTSPLLTQNRWWETTIEHPDMVPLGGRWLLFFSGGLWENSSYAISYANCQGPLGPCADPNTTPVFGSEGEVAGPGAPSIFTDTTGTLWMAYNAWTAGAVGYPEGARSLRMDPLCLVDNTPVLRGPTTSPQALTPSCPTGLPDGYQLSASDGGIFSFHTPFGGSVGGAHLQAPVVGIAADPSGGYWEVAADGGIFAFGAPFDGSLAGWTLRAPIVGMAATPDGGGYWEVDSQGHVATFCDADNFGSIGGFPLQAPIVAMAADPGGGGYWEVASDGGVFAFGDATFYGSMGGKKLDAPVVGIAPTPDGGGYWEVASDGGIFAFGDAPFDGSMGGRKLDAPVVGMARIGT
jgi:Glycosyl hydrolases family 43